MQLSKEQLAFILRWAKAQHSKSGDLLARARQALLEWDRVVVQYNPVIDIEPVWYGVVIHHRCGCLAWRKDKPCKHVLALLLLEHKEILCAHSPKWREFFASLPPRSPRVPREFEDF